VCWRAGVRPSHGARHGSAANLNLVKAALCAALYPNVVKVIIPPDKGRGQKKRLRKEDIHFHVRREPDEESDDEGEGEGEGGPGGAMTGSRGGKGGDASPEGQIKAVLERFRASSETSMEFPACERLLAAAAAAAAAAAP
jgi:hypothetical protein